jgi:hypothetical protein
MLELSPNVLVRYTEKLKVIDNMDPSPKLSFKINQFPPIDKSEIKIYFTKIKSPYSDEEGKAYKSLESYKYYESKYVREMYVKSSDRVRLIMGIVQRELRGDLVSCWIVIDLYASDIANALLDKVNSHVGTMLFAIMTAELCKK